MPIVNAAEMTRRAYREGWAVAQLNTNGGDYALSRAILEAAEAAKSPVILGVYENNAQYAGYDYIVTSLLALTRRFAPSVPVAIHLDHGGSFDACAKAIRAGFTSVMFDGSKGPLSENITQSRRVADLAHAVGVTTEAELGHLLSGEADTDNPNLVSVDDVKELTAAVDVDLLAVAIGNSHGFYKGEPKLNMERLEMVRNATEVPLVLHGTTGLSTEQIRGCVALGMAKVNLGTVLRTSHVTYTKEAIETVDHQGHPWRVSQAVKERLQQDCGAFFEIVGSAGKG